MVNSLLESRVAFSRFYLYSLYLDTCLSALPILDHADFPFHFACSLPLSELNHEQIETKTTTTEWINLTNSKHAVEARGGLLLALGGRLSGSRRPGRQARRGLPGEGLPGDSGCIRALGTRLPSSCGAAASGGGAAGLPWVGLPGILMCFARSTLYIRLTGVSIPSPIHYGLY